MTEGEQDRGTTATGTTVIASSDVHDADIARARGEDDEPKRPAEERDASQSQPGRREEPAHADDAGTPPPAANEPLQACPPSTTHRLRKHPLALAAAVGMLVLLLAAAGAGTGLAVWAYHKEQQATKAEHEAVDKQKKAENAEAELKAKLQQLEETRKATAKERDVAQAAEKAARRSEEETKAVLDFFTKTLLSAGRPGDVSLSDTFWAGGQGKDLTLRKAVDVAESQVAEAFADRPLGEASVREMLGLTYLNLGEAAQAVKQYERALELREGMQGVSHPDTAACRNQLAVAYRLAGRTVEAGRLFDQNPNSPAHASALAVTDRCCFTRKNPPRPS